MSGEKGAEDVTEAGKVGEMYADLAKDAYTPYESPVAKATSAVRSAAA